jgi:Asp-tRNA(Asn)/Glu-tRNA(Gln) amidotransferase A subunit family amidase
VSYAASLRADGLSGARIGVLHQAYDTPTLDDEVGELFNGVVGELRNLGAEVIDPVEVPGLDDMGRGGGCNQFKHDLNQYLGRLGDKAPMHSLADIIKSRRFHPSIQARLESGQATDDLPGETPGCRNREAYREKLRAAVLKLMDAAQLDALAYPTWSNPPRLIGDLNTPGGDNSQLFSPSTGFPAITVPMGFTRGGRTAAARPAVERTDPPQARLRLRAGDPPSSRARRHAAAADPTVGADLWSAPGRSPSTPLRTGKPRPYEYNCVV